MRAGSATTVLLLSASLAGAQQAPRLQQLQALYEQCVWAEFLNKSGPIAADRALASCPLEENALVSTTALLLTGPVTRAETAMLQARAQVDQLKLAIKLRMLAPIPAARRRP